MTRTHRLAWLALLLTACSAGADPTPSDPGAEADPATGGSADPGAGGSVAGDGGGGGSPIDPAGQGGGPAPEPECPLLPSDVVADASFNPTFAPFYSFHDLGPVPGIAGRLGGCVLKAGTTDTLLIAGDSEASNGAVYEITIERDACQHIVGFSGTATKVADTPYVDANLIYGESSLLIYPEWPENKISQLPAGATTPATTIDMGTMGIDSSVSGLGVVPVYLPAAGGTRTLTWPAGNWYHLDLAYDGSLYGISNPQLATTLGGGPGGFAYVPPGSPGFPNPAIIVAEWSDNKVAVYEANEQGDPIVATRQELFHEFPRPWGAYFDPVAGDYVFLTWGSEPERVFVVHGFTAPPEPPPPDVPE